MNLVRVEGAIEIPESNPEQNYYALGEFRAKCHGKQDTFYLINNEPEDECIELVEKIRLAPLSQEE